MLKNKKRMVIIFSIIVISVFSAMFIILFQKSSVEALSKYGSRGEEERYW